TAMTGRQTTAEREHKDIDIKRVVEGCGVACHEYFYTNELSKTIDFFKDIKKVYEQTDGPVVVVAREFCVLDKERSKEFLPSLSVMVDEEKCVACDLCVSSYKCPPMAYNANGKVEIDPFLCIGCGSCLDALCPTDAFVKIDKGDK
ncbi:MAG: indolepyruvate oxidoreductase, partial [Sulfurovaceae bacterium]